MKFLKWVFILLIFIFTGIEDYSRSQAAVTLIYFDAVPGDGQVLLKWETATELNTFGYFVQRGFDQENYVRLHLARIPAQGGSGIIGGVYEYTDSGLLNGQTYWYRLEEIEIINSVGRSIFHEPVSAIPCEDPPCPLPPTATPTVTKTPTITKTSSSSPARTPTPTRTNSPGGSSTKKTSTATTVSAYPGPSSSGAQVTVTTGSGGAAYPAPTSGQETTIIPLTEEVTSSEPGDATATLIPLPSITMIFPKSPTSGQLVAVAGQNISSNNAPRSGWRSPQRLAVIAIVLAVWVILGGWFFFSFRRLD